MLPRHRIHLAGISPRGAVPVTTQHWVSKNKKGVEQGGGRSWKVEKGFDLRTLELKMTSVMAWCRLLGNTQRHEAQRRGRTNSVAQVS